MVLVYVIAFLVAAVFAGIELGQGRRVYSDPGAFSMWLGVLIIEGGLAAVAAFFLDQETHWPHGVVGVVAGLGFAAALHQRFADVAGNPWGFAFGYDRLRGVIDGALDRRSSATYVVWESLVSKVLLEKGKLRELGRRLSTYSANVNNDPASAAGGVQTVTKIRRTLHDKKTDDERKMELLLQLAKNVGAIAVVEKLYCEVAGKRPLPVVPKAVVGVAALAIAAGTAAILFAPGKSESSEPLPIGRAFVVDQVAFTVDGVETATNVGPRTRADGIYVIVKVSLRNESQRTATVSRDQFLVKTANGREQVPAHRTTTVLPQSMREEHRLLPDEQQTRLIAFDVQPDDLEGLTVEVKRRAGLPRNAPKFVDLAFKNKSPRLGFKRFHGRTERNLRVARNLVIAFSTAPKRVRQFAVHGRHGCRSARRRISVSPSGRFSYRDAGGLRVSGRFESTIEATGEMTQLQSAKRHRCIRAGKSIGWTARATP